MSFSGALAGLAAYGDSDSEDSGSDESPGNSSVSQPGCSGAGAAGAAASKPSHVAEDVPAQQGQAKMPRLNLPSATDLLDSTSDLGALREAAATSSRPAGSAAVQQGTPDWKKPDERGRVRNFAPEEGSYATTVMIPGHAMHSVMLVEMARTLRTLLLCNDRCHTVSLPQDLAEALVALVQYLQERFGAVHPIGQVAARCQPLLAAPAGPEAAAAAGAKAAVTASTSTHAITVTKGRSAELQQTSRLHSHSQAATSGSSSSTLNAQLAAGPTGVPSAGPGGSDTTAAATAHSPCEVLHLSLSRTLPLRFHLVPTLLQELAEQLAPCARCTLTLKGTEVFVNDERTRTFIALPMHRKGPAGQQTFHQVCQLIAAVNKAFLMHGLQTYYKDPRPHISFAWIAGDHEQALVEALEQLPSDLSDRLQLELPVQRIVCRLGTLEREVWNASSKAAVTIATARSKQ